MSDKCCFGTCLLSSATFIALIFGVIQALYGLFWNVQLLMIIEEKNIFDFMKLFVTVNKISDFQVVHGFILASIGLNAFWVISAIIAARGNTRLKHSYLTPWVLITYSFTIFDVVATIYFSVKVQDSYSKTPFLMEHSTGRGSVTLTYLTLLVLFSRGGFMWFINVYLAHLVEKRGKEIDFNHSALMLYILSHLSRRSLVNEDLQCLERPPAYNSSCPNFLPSAFIERNDSSWSISSDTLRGLTGYSNNSGSSNIKSLSTVDLRHAISQNVSPSSQCQPMNVSNSFGGVLPY